MILFSHGSYMYWKFEYPIDTLQKQKDCQLGLSELQHQHIKMCIQGRVSFRGGGGIRPPLKTLCPPLGIATLQN